MSKEEYETLKRLEGDWRWIARDSAGLDREKLYLYSEKPYKDHGTGVWSTDDNRAFPVDDYLFQFIQWEDGDPYSIVNLIREYEWAQLMKEHLPVKEEQEKEKVKIPQFVFDWIEECKEVNVLDEIFYLENSTTSQNMRKEQKLYFWLRKNFDTFAKAWLTYPDVEIEEEQRYYVLLLRRDEKGDSFNYLAKDNYHDRLWIEDSRTDGLAWDERSSFTEKEIRKLDKGDVLFRHFAVKVEELEE